MSLKDLKRDLESEVASAGFRLKELLKRTLGYIESLELAAQENRRRPAMVCQTEGCARLPVGENESWLCPKCAQALRQEISDLKDRLLKMSEPPR
jgi:hypothetical protein